MTILLLAGWPETGRRWVEILAGPGVTIWPQRPTPGDGRPDLIVTDLPQTEARASDDPGIVASGLPGRPTCGSRPIAQRASCGWPADFWPRSSNSAAASDNRPKFNASSPGRPSAIP